MRITDELDTLHVVKFKLCTEGNWSPTRYEIREVGRIRNDYKLSPQRRDETYLDFIDRLIGSLEGMET